MLVQCTVYCNDILQYTSTPYIVYECTHGYIILNGAHSTNHGQRPSPRSAPATAARQREATTGLTRLCADTRAPTDRLTTVSEPDHGALLTQVAARKQPLGEERADEEQPTKRVDETQRRRHPADEAWPMARRRACTRHTRVLTRTSRRTRAADGTAARIDAWIAAWTAESTRTHAQPGHAHPRAAEAAQAARRTAEAGSARRGVSEAVPCNKPCTARGGPRRALLKARSAATPQDGS